MWKISTTGSNKNGSSGFLWIWRLTICSGASGNVTAVDVAFMLNDLGVKTDVDHRKLTLSGDVINDHRRSAFWFCVHLFLVV